MSVIENLLGLTDEIRRGLEDLRDEHPGELALIDAQIAALHARRSALLAWTGDQLGDWAIAREVARYRQVPGSGGWGKARTEEWWTCEAAFTVGEMAAVFGPDWVHVVALVRRAAALTPSERSAYNSAWSADYHAHVSEYEAAWRAVFVGGGPGDAARRALWAFGDYGDRTYVVAALARRSEIDVKHYEVRTRVWRRMFGPIHPDDPAIA